MKKNGILVVFALALALRAGYVLGFPLRTAVDDAYQYDTIGWNIASGAGFSLQPGFPTPERAPGFPFFLSLVYFLFGHSLLMATLAQAVVGALTCLLLYDLAKRLFDERTAMAAAWFACLYPVTVAYTGLLLSETLFTFFFVLCICLFVRSGGGEKKGWLALSGAALGLTTLVRATTILFPAGIFLALLLSGTGRPFRKTALFMLAFALAILPWTARNYVRFGVFLPVATGGSTCLFATGRMTEGVPYTRGFEEIPAKWKELAGAKEFWQAPESRIAFDRLLKAEGMKKIKSHPFKYFSIVLQRLPKYWLSSHSSVLGVDKPLGEYYAKGEYFPIVIRAGLLLFHGGILLLTGLGMFYSRGSFRKWAVILLILLYFNMHAFFDMCPRYFVPIFPYMFVFCVIALFRLRDRFFNPEREQAGT
ncbi:MAG: glycosyltransferase family 39 protein [Elusimicrobiota bacterium]|nr:glycosyltransferase family 39 protein [Elusimicrobiota bacterium]